MHGDGPACETSGAVGEGVLMTSPVVATSGLQLGGVSADDIATAVGTPAFVYDAGVIRARVAQLQRALEGVPHSIHYACKANGSLGILRVLLESGVAVDVVSGGELFRAQAAGFAADQIIFGGVGKTERELGEALRAGVHVISAESLDEVHLINRVAEQLNVVARVGLRVNPEVRVDAFHSYIKTGEKGAKFGIPIDRAYEAAVTAAALPQVHLVAIGMHVGSQISQFNAYADGLARLEELVTRIRAAGISTLEALDLGGGFFVPYDSETPIDLAAYRALVAPVITRLGLTLIVEPGRFLVAESGALLTRVLYRKAGGTDGHEILVTDAGMNDLLRPSLYAAFHRIDPVSAHDERSVSSHDIVGPICETGDFFALARMMPRVGVGELLCVRTVGAYGYSMSSNYNARPRAAEVLVDNGQFAVITLRETYEDLIRRESVSPQWLNARSNDQ